MWVNSYLAKWEQDTRVMQALRKAERNRMRRAAQNDDVKSGTGGVESVRARLRWPADAINSVAHLVQSMFETQLLKAREQRQASR